MIREGMSVKQKVIHIFRPGLSARAMIKEIRNDFKGRPLVGVEIGVAEGYNAYNILRMLNVERLYLVDSYKGDWIRAFGLSQKLLKPFKDKVVFINQRSENAVKSIPPVLDFVYIDGDHSYDGVKSDFFNYFNKVKPGGYIGGHDFNMYGYEVIRFVNELHDEGYDVKAYNNDWWVKKDG